MSSDAFQSLIIYMVMAAFVSVLVVLICNAVRKNHPKLGHGKEPTQVTTITMTTTPSSLLEVKVTFPIKVIFGDVTVAKKYDPSELAQIPKTRLGEGTLGTLFKVVLGCGSVTTIRKIREGLIVSAGALEMWVNFFGGMKDDGLLLPIHFSFWYGGEAFILYEYLILGSLEELLHAQAVALIHSRVTQNAEPLICGVIKASNILIRVDFSACLSSYETPYLVPPEMIVKRNPGRVAPELKGHHRKIFTQESDVYSFGILLLELVTGQRPSMTNLRAYVNERKVKGGLNCVYDKKMGDAGNGNLAEMIEIAWICLSCKPHDRPSMDGVVRMIQSL
ncbi:hypothetical protein GQ457_03G003000 [Hibiscus cannabinus]